MIDWQSYWESWPRKFADDDYVRQVARTTNGGIPVSSEQLELVVDHVVALLDLRTSDRLLDLCCGNGLLTRRLAERCASAVGVDFSSALVEVARGHHGGPAIEYCHGSALDLAACVATPPPFDKVCMIEGLQYFSPADLPALLSGIRAISAPEVRVGFVSVTDASRIWSFFDTPERRASYEQQRREGREIMGHWWTLAELEPAARDAGFVATSRPQPAHLVTSHYRFDLLLDGRP